ncbi:MAG: methylated-DNA--[protein]-cysteine S-methyltransferase [Gammaproteobacteria bacterium]|nr:methylated-DNA--[protein]-cysteine S-methyltransferase [Gammaproteobacteria bacterium]NIR83443.1 methylated-DNA--[protein]-cysteine S-methyltransferase [Gammaproteobacteria bacterium]NIR91365.1 methylated-DNA--[protein]-cysteine S-methyltransferase [Gammaproteobacteria bacterium]NIU04605.1 methylated-DNA--[protein]-cysteine S-methyltransferase [Gammaproteobacteria bacterium]NIV51647.1 methylated-DNA--[protein]-cysteine S-methyltransferase [Gammaproteobacteria bacterium]
MPRTTCYTSTFNSPCGPLVCVVDEAGVVLRVEFAKGRRPSEIRNELARAGVRLVEDPGRTRVVRDQLQDYFSGRRRRFGLELAPQGTAFQRSVWRALQDIPFGETRTYADIARAIGRPRASRAVGRATGANPIPIVIPCHRVVGSDGSLVGFGGGLDVKAALLAHEGQRRSYGLPLPV